MSVCFQRLQTMLWCHKGNFFSLLQLVNSHQRWKQTRNHVCFHLWGELTLALWCHSIVWSLFSCNGMTSFMEFKHNEKFELNYTGVSHVQPVATMINLLTSSMATSYNNEIYGMTSLYSVATAFDSNIMQYKAVALGNYSTTMRHERTFLKKWLTTIHGAKTDTQFRDKWTIWMKR